MNLQNNTAVPTLIGNNVIVRLGIYEDMLEIIKFYEENQIFLQQFADPYPAERYTEKFWAKELKHRLQDFKKDQALRLFVFSNKKSEVIGYCNFYNFVRGAFHACYLGYGISEKGKGKGLMTESLKLAIPYVFDALKLHRIMANYDPMNHRSASLLKNIGFEQEGLAKNYLYYHGRWNDHILTALTNNELKFL